MLAKSIALHGKQHEMIFIRLSPADESFAGDMDAVRMIKLIGIIPRSVVSSVSLFMATTLFPILGITPCQYKKGEFSCFQPKNQSDAALIPDNAFCFQFQIRPAQFPFLTFFQYNNWYFNEKDFARRVNSADCISMVLAPRECFIARGRELASVCPAP